MTSKFSYHPGSIPLLVSFPHSGTDVPEAIADRMTPTGNELPDTDWFLPRLYDFVQGMGASTIAANFSRYVIDPNRSTDGENLYPGQPTPKLCPEFCFNGKPIYLPGRYPDEFEIGRRTAEYWRPYHDRIQEELARLKHIHGFAVLFDSHSILSHVPRLFEGRLPDINIGTNRGATCDAKIQSAIEEALKQQDICDFVFNGRFVGGHITRNYGQPGNHVHSVQLELSQVRYMNEETGEWDAAKANETRIVLHNIMEAIVKSASELVGRM